MLSSAVGIHSQVVVIYENERYSPLSGWSAKGLLITDRKNLSTGDGKLGWNTFQELEKDMISNGWDWDPDSPGWEVELHESADSDGWSYGTDFSSFHSGEPGDQGDNELNLGSAKKGMIHFVRRRKRVRSQFFDGKEISTSITYIYRMG